MWVSFLAIGVLAVGCGWIVQRLWPARWSGFVTVVVVVAVVISGFSILGGPTLLGPLHWWQRSPTREIVLFLVMLVGMAARYLTKAIEDRRERVAKWRADGSRGRRPAIELDRWEFIYPLLVSTLTFGALLGQIESDTLTIENVLIGFQSGFFWQTLLAKSEPR